MKTVTCNTPGKTGKTCIFPHFPRFRIADGLPGKTGKTPIRFSPFPRSGCVAVEVMK